MTITAVKRYLWGWLVRFGANYVRLAVLTTIAGYVVFALILLRQIVAGGEPPISLGARAVVAVARGFNVMLVGVTGGGDFEGGFTELGGIVMTFVAPYLFWLSSGLAVVETLTGWRSLGWLSWPLRRQLQGVVGLWAVFTGLAIFQSVEPPQVFPYWLRGLLFAGLFGVVAFHVVVLWALNRACERLVQTVARSGEV
ncbi:hypothetical protein ACQ4N7_16305 [Nodosilinea sp. AN01ver1]|uniref:hypothetical protein n=1 Tax=Nodosilinea sp. AN01ver1 TaxID=3423362 RepID=UPI003D31899F